MSKRQTRPARHRRATVRRPLEPRVDELPGGKYLWGEGDLQLVKAGEAEEPTAPPDTATRRRVPH